MRIFVLISVAALSVAACSDDGERYGVTYVDRTPVAASQQG